MNPNVPDQERVPESGIYPIGATRNRIASVLASEQTEGRADTMKSIAQANFKRWNDTLKTKDAHAVAGLYSADCTFLPTQSGEFRHGQSGAESYFHHFLEKNPEGKIVDEAVQELGSDAYLHSGMYNFELGPEGNRSTVEARFTYVWKKDEQGQWKIAHHHSSVKPKPAN